MSQVGTSLTGARVLVVDDEPDIAALLAFHLARASFRVRTVADGPETFRAVEAERPDLIVLDVLLPGLSGLEVLQSLHAHLEFREIPVVLLTARGGEAERIEGLRLGADDYIPKPFSPPELVLRVEAVLRRTRQEPPRPRGRVLRTGPFIVDLDAAQVQVQGGVSWTSLPSSSGCCRCWWSARGGCRAGDSCFMRCGKPPRSSPPARWTCT